MKKFLWLLVLSLAAFSQTPENIIQKAETSLRGLKTFQADFEQLYFSSTSSIPLREKGEFFFAKPDRMKWIYKSPEKKTFLSMDGVFSYYIPEDNQLYRGSIDQERPESEVLFILSGRKSILDGYKVELSAFPSENNNVEQMKLIPREEDGYTHLLLELDKRSYLISRLILFDWAGNKTEYIFKRIKTNERFGSNLFELKVPENVEIIEY